MREYRAKKKNGYNANIEGPYLVINASGLVVVDRIPDMEGAKAIADNLNRDAVNVRTKEAWFKKATVSGPQYFS